jgi:hypothetical protein
MNKLQKEIKKNTSAYAELFMNMLEQFGYKALKQASKEASEENGYNFKQLPHGFEVSGIRRNKPWKFSLTKHDRLK